jgi:hypothetical protein
VRLRRVMRRSASPFGAYVRAVANQGGTSCL